jgi:hypothetical protein
MGWPKHVARLSAAARPRKYSSANGDVAFPGDDRQSEAAHSTVAGDARVDR